LCLPQTIWWLVRWYTSGIDAIVFVWNRRRRRWWCVLHRIIAGRIGTGSRWHIGG